MKNKILLPILVLAAMTLTACNLPAEDSAPSSKQDETSIPAEVSSDEPVVSSEEPISSDEPISSEDPVTYGVEIANKAALQGEWYADTTRDLDVTLTPAANALQELNKKTLTVTSSDDTVVAVTGLGLKGLKAGTATITVKYHDATDSVAVTILDNSAKGKYGVAHEGTAADPFTNEDALAVAKSEKYEGEVYYVKGKIASFYNAPGSRTDGMVAYFLEPATAGGEKFEIYKCFKEDGSALTDDDIWVGGEATAYGAFTKYNSQYETSSAVFVSCTGNKPQARQTLTKTFAETLALGVALDDGADSYDYIKFQGYVTAKSGNNYWLTATKGEALVSGKSDAAHGERDIYTNGIELYNAGKVAELVAKLLEGAKVEVTMIVKNYHGTVENGKDLVDADVTVLEAGTAWAVPEPAVADRTLAEFIAGENTKAKAYNVTATIKAFKDGATKDKYGNMTVTDGTNDLIIYGCSATATALAWDNSSAYAFTNPQDFLTNEVTSALAIGTEITMKLIRADYNGTIEASGIITSVKAVDPTGIELDQATLEIEEGMTGQLVASILPAGASGVVTWESSDPTVATVSNNGVVLGVAAGTATITVKVGTFSATCAVTVKASTVVTNLERASSIAVGDKIVLACDNGTVKKQFNGITGTSTKIGEAVDYTAAVPAEDKAILDVVAGVNADTFAFKLGEQYLTWTSGNTLNVQDAIDENSSWTVAFAEGNATIANVKDSARKLQYNAGSPRFCAYTSAQTAVQIWKFKSATPQPEVAQPIGSFSGYAVAADDSNMFVNIAIANEKVFVEVGSVIKTTTTFAFDKTTGIISINLGDYGVFSATYDEANGKLINAGIEGAAAAYLKNNNAIELVAAANYWNCDGTTDELRAIFQRRYRANGASSWTVDNNADHTDRIVSDTTNFIAGTGALSVRPYSGSGNAVGLNLVNDFDEAKTVKNIGFWVYNSSANDISLRTWVYTAKGLTSAKEIGGLTAKANGWTYCRMGFDYGAIYNFNVSNWNGSANALVFDNIVLF